MEKYIITKQLGDGTFGSVLLATVKTTGEKCAIKKLETNLTKRTKFTFKLFINLKVRVDN